MSKFRFSAVVVIVIVCTWRPVFAVCPVPENASGSIKAEMGETESTRSSIEMAVIPLKYADANSLSGVLGQIRGRESTESRSQFVFDSRTNSIIVRATASRLAGFRALIEKLDVKTANDNGRTPDAALRTCMQVSVYEVSLSRDRLSDVAVKGLTAHAGSLESLDKALAKLGSARMVYRADQVLNSERKTRKTTLGAAMPFVRGVSVSRDGNRTSSIDYEDVGLIVKAAGVAHSATRGVADVDIEYSGVGKSNVDIGNDVKAPITRNLEQDFSGDFESGKPIILLLVDAQGEGDPVVYVTRIQFDIEPL